MLDFMGNLSAVLISLIIVAGFLAVAGVVVFEIGTMLVFWLRHSFDSTKNQALFTPARPPTKKMPRPTHR
jgi:hypothetical protein